MEGYLNRERVDTLFSFPYTKPTSNRSFMDNKAQSLPLILASQSPRRKELLTEAGYTFSVCAPDDSVEKGVCSKCSPSQLVVDSAVAKAAAIASQSAQQGISPAIILAADTVGVCKAEVLGKPVDADHARQMLRLMSGTVHEVMTGVCLWHLSSNQFLTFLEKTTVEMDVLSDCLLYTSPSPRDGLLPRMPSSA